jgi:hypothetical protein
MKVFVAGATGAVGRYLVPKLVADGHEIMGRIFRAKNLSFSVTPKGRLGDDRSRQGTPLLLVALMVASAAAAGIFGATLLGLTPLHYGVPEAAIAAACWMTLNLT